MGWCSSLRGHTPVLLEPIVIRPLLMRMVSNNAWMEVSLREFEAMGAKLEGSIATNEKRLANVKKVIDGAKIPMTAPAGNIKRRKMLHPPVEPRESECCGTGCADCVWMTY